MRLPPVPLLITSLVTAPLLTACGAAPERLGTAREADTICPGNSTLQGVDVSHYDGAIDWPTVQGSGVSFGFVKATEGTCYTDPEFATNWPAMQQAGVVRSAYHFFHSNVDPIAAADFHLQVMGPLQPGDLPPALDLEVTDGSDAATITANAIAWLDHVAAATGLTPILYVSTDFVNSTLGNPAGLDSHAQLWIADWQVTCPDVPAPFTSFAFWQDSSTGSVCGIGSGSVDTDVFNGSASDLAALTLQGSGSGGAGGSGSGGSGGLGSGGSASQGSGGMGGAGSGGSSGAGPSSGNGNGTGNGSGGGNGTTGAGHPGSGSGGGGVNASSGCAAATGDAGSGAGAVVAALGLVVAARRRRCR